jgi:hypothetical protein
MCRLNAREHVRQMKNPVSLALAPISGLQFADSLQEVSQSFFIWVLDDFIAHNQDQVNTAQVSEGSKFRPLQELEASGTGGSSSRIHG